MKINFTAEIPESLVEANQRLERYGRWAMDRNRRRTCGSAEGRYRSAQDDQDRQPPEVLLHIDEALACQRALARVPEQERRILAIIYIPSRQSVEVQLRLAHIPARLCQERHLRGLRMFDNIFKSTV